MKTPEDIKRGIECCIGNCNVYCCDECPYWNMYDGCPTYGKSLREDNLAYIQQLEASCSQVSKALCGKENATLDEVLQAVSQVQTELEAVKRERDAVLYDLATREFACDVCVHGQRNRDDCEELFGETRCCFEWRGVCLENTEVRDDA